MVRCTDLLNVCTFWISGVLGYGVMFLCLSSFIGFCLYACIFICPCFMNVHLILWGFAKLSIYQDNVFCGSAAFHTGGPGVFTERVSILGTTWLAVFCLLLELYPGTLYKFLQLCVSEIF